MKKDLLKRVLSIGLAATMCAGLLSGCGSKETAEPATEASKTDSAKTDSADEKTVIRVVHATQNIGQADGEQIQKVQDAINEYIGDKINVQ